jgi:glycosyltransferase involved in cell wall biosynthesis
MFMPEGVILETFQGGMMRILIVSDAWPPQVNGVVRTLQTVGRELGKRGHEVHYITPEGHRTWAIPSYPEIRLSLVGASVIGREIDAIKPEAIHIATEGPLGWAARRACLRRGLPFTTSFHTRFAEYIETRLPIPGVGGLMWRLLRLFHSPSRAVMTPTATIANELEARKFVNVKVWTRGVEHSKFNNLPRDYFSLPRPVVLYAGRVVKEKNMEAFLNLETPGTKVVVGDGPERKLYEDKHPAVVFTGYLGEEIYARALASADVFVFPSLTDTFGLVMIEAMACGTPVAAFNVASPIDVVESAITGELDEDLSIAVAAALKLDRDGVRRGAAKFTWKRVAEMFESWLVPVDAAKVEAMPAKASRRGKLRAVT